MSSIYFGGSRHPKNINTAQIAAVIAAAVASNQGVHVGCQFGADAQVITAFLHTNTPCSKLSLFTVSHIAPPWFHTPAILGASVTLSAGGTTAPIPARYLLRSIAAFQGCQSAVFFSPGAGSLAVAREATAHNMPVFAFAQSMPARIPSTAGGWVPSSFMGFPCWQWQAPTQPTLF
jgi:hypothetical protein